MGKKAIMIAVGSSVVLCLLCVTFLLLLRGLEPRKRDRVETVTVVPPIQAKRMMENFENEEEFPSEPRFLTVANPTEKSNIENIFYSQNTTSQGFRRNDAKNKTTNQGYYENLIENERHLKENASDSQSLSNNNLTCRMLNLSSERNNDRDDKENENIATELPSQSKRNVVQIISSKPEVNTNSSGTLTTE